MTQKTIGLEKRHDEVLREKTQNEKPETDISCFFL